MVGRQSCWAAKIDGVLGAEMCVQGGEGGGEVEGIVGEFSPALGRDRDCLILVATVDGGWGRWPARVAVGDDAHVVLRRRERAKGCSSMSGFLWWRRFVLRTPGCCGLSGRWQCFASTTRIGVNTKIW
jgi:hypothetical protein